ncbi:DUF4396 domain-containing protein [Streptomyces sp. NPDC127069]|uniref:DUF4396 domain-containing protein n=1 Tax=Streptomyces sp. NPDC127069 TaxID=3347128 RepID=UPI00365295A0
MEQPHTHHEHHEHQGHEHEHQGHEHEHHGHEQHQHHEQHADDSDHGHAHAHGVGPVGWGMAARATLHCLTGCAIGEVLGMIVGTALGWGNLPTMILAIVLAFFFGYALTLRGILAAGVDFRSAVRVALAADTLSIAVMELIDNGVIAVWPGAMDAHLSEALFWIALAISLALAFVVTTPVNKWMIGRGKGHAVVHQYHH